MNSQTKLTDAQLIVLSAASQRGDLRVLLPLRLRGGAADKMLKILMGKGLIEAIADPEPGLRLQEANESVATKYRISLAGLARIGISSDEPIAARESERGCEPMAPAARPAQVSGASVENVEADNVATTGPVDRQSWPAVDSPVPVGGVLGDQGSGPAECPDLDGHSRPALRSHAELANDL